MQAHQGAEDAVFEVLAGSRALHFLLGLFCFLCSWLPTLVIFSLDLLLVQQLIGSLGSHTPLTLWHPEVEGRGGRDGVA